jgi:murein DD-endopeptidase MepM/ murein hydrolase activator NlpD
VFKKTFAAIRLKDNWNYRKNRLVLYINIAFVALAFYALISPYLFRNDAPAPTSPEALAKNQVPAAQELTIERFEGEIRKNMTLSDLMASHNLSEEMIYQLMVVTKPIYNLKKLIVGNRFELEKLPDGTLKSFSYAVDPHKYVEVALTDEGYKAEMKPFEFETHQEMISGRIRGSLFQTMNELAEGDQLALDMAETFSYDIDFNKELRSGDHFRLAVEKHYQDGKFVKYGKILAAEFSNKGKAYSAFYFTDSEGRSGYYDAQGRSLQRPLLKSPIKLSRISATFSRRRFHPLLGVFRPHLGVDYAASVGTPVYAAGSGRVEFAGWKSGFGKFIQVNHGSEYSTMYGHLSRFALGIRKGAVVKQGQAIGYVGATGLATGPHLDYRITRRGVFVNPLSIKFQPSVPLRPEYLMAFEADKQRWQYQLARLDLSKSPQQVMIVQALAAKDSEGAKDN